MIDRNSVENLLHELSPIIGRLRVYAEQETHDYANSRTKATIDLLVNKIEKLRQSK